MIQCLTCGSDVTEKKFCQQCGAKVLREEQIACPQCHLQNQVHAAFCMHCGQALTRQSPSSFETKQCLSCQTRIEAGTIFCPRCGRDSRLPAGQTPYPPQHASYPPQTPYPHPVQQLVLQCPHCQMIAPLNAQYCGHCHMNFIGLPPIPLHNIHNYQHYKQYDDNDDYYRRYHHKDRSYRRKKDSGPFDDLFDIF